MANSVLSTKCSKWVHGRYAKVYSVTSTMTKSLFVKDNVKQRKELLYQLKN